MPSASGAFRDSTHLSWFRRCVAAAVGLGAALRILYVENFPTKVFLGGDGLDYHLMANRLANGEGYVNGFTGVGQNAHHPPGWVTLLAATTKLGAESLVAHQRVGTVVGLLLIVVTAYLGARLFGPRTGATAGFIAAIYPGFWVLDAQILSEPLALALLGISLLLVLRLVDSPSMKLAMLVGFTVGLGVLVRTEQAAVFAVVIPLALLRASALTTRIRLRYAAVIGAIVVAMLAPWAAHNAGRFEEPVLLSSNFGSTLLAGNCNTYSGELLGFYDIRCNSAIAQSEQPADRSVHDGLARDAAIENILDNLDRLPVTMLARLGRTTGLYAPGHTVELVAAWHATSEWPIWLWVTSFWPLAILAAHGIVTARKTDIWVLPLMVPIVITIGVVLVFYGEPRYHTPADLSLVIFAAWSITRLTSRADDAETEPAS